MRKLLRNKKGVSPLIATIFLMAFAVGLGAVVMQFSEGLIGGDEKTACGADFDMVITKICMKSTKDLQFTAKNNGNIEINGVQVRITDMNGKDAVQEFMKAIATKSKLSQKISHRGKIQAVQFIPMVRQGIAKDAKPNACISKATLFTKDDIDAC